jgi:hypothetical protein
MVYPPEVICLKQKSHVFLFGKRALTGTCVIQERRKRKATWTYPAPACLRIMLSVSILSSSNFIHQGVHVIIWYQIKILNKTTLRVLVSSTQMPIVGLIGVKPRERTRIWRLGVLSPVAT